MQTAPPWSNNTDQLPARLAALDLPQLSDTAGALHHHIRLYIYVDGQPVVVPANIGLSNQAARRRCTRTTTTGVGPRRVGRPELPAGARAVHGRLGARTSRTTCLGDQCNEGDQQLRVFVNGQQYVGDPTLDAADRPDGAS